ERAARRGPDRSTGACTRARRGAPTGEASKSCSGRKAYGAEAVTTASASALRPGADASSARPTSSAGSSAARSRAVPGSTPASRGASPPPAPWRCSLSADQPTVGESLGGAPCVAPVAFVGLPLLAPQLLCAPVAHRHLFRRFPPRSFAARRTRRT